MQEHEFVAQEPVAFPEREAPPARVPDQAWEAMLDQMVEAAFFFDMAGRLVVRNRAARSMVPWLEPGMDWHDYPNFRGLVRPPDRRVPEGDLPLVRALRGEKVAMEEFWVQIVGSPPLAVLISASPTFVGGRQVGALLIAHDITSNRAVEEALRASEARLRSLMENAPAIITMMDLEGRLRYVNRSLAGRDVESYVGRLAEEFLAPGERERFRAACGEVRRTGRPVHAEFEVHGYLAQPRWFDIILAPIQDNGRPAGLVGVGIDITEAKQAREELAEQRQLLLHAERLAAMGSWCLCLEFGKVRWSEGLYRILGYEPGSVEPGQAAFRARLCPEDRAKLERNYEALVAGDLPMAWEFQIVRPSGEMRMVRVNGTLERNARGQPTKAIGVMHDITEQLEMERMKNEFIATVSHELRTPLTAVRAPLTLLLNDWRRLTPEDMDELLEIAVDGVDRMVRLVNDVLDIQRLATGRLSIALAPADARDLVEEALQGLTPRAKAAGVALRVRAPRLPLETDAARVVQVLSNLLDNALSFAPSGSAVDVRARKQGRYVRFDVADRGPGIPPDQLEAVFERFKQLDQGTKRRKGGTGLGLAISREIVGLLGGRIWAERRRGGGTTFSFVLPT